MDSLASLVARVSRDMLAARRAVPMCVACERLSVARVGDLCRSCDSRCECCGRVECTAPDAYACERAWS